MATEAPFFRRLADSFRSLPARGVLALASGFLLQLSMGCMFTFGNLTTYLTSYLHVRGGQDVSYGETVWVGSALGITEGLALLPGTVLYQRRGPRIVVLLGSVVASGAIALTSLTVDTSLAWVTMTYGVANGLGIGFVYGVPLLVGYKWFPNHKGLVSGVVVGGYGLGGILFTTIQTGFINPDNVSPEEDGFFHDAALLDRVPKVFLLQAGVCAVLQVVGVIGTCDPPGHKIGRSVGGKQESDVLTEDSEPERGLDDVTALSVSSNEQSVYSLKDALRTSAMYQLLLAFLCNNFSIGILNPLWKSFGQTFIKDDRFLELVGSGSSVFNMLGRLTWGFLCDIFGYKPVMVLLTGLFSALMYTLQATSDGGKVMYLLWIWATFFCFSGTFSVVVTGTAVTFGTKNAGQIYGVIFLGGAVLGPLVPVLTNFLLDRYGYSVVFLLSGIVATGSLVSTLTFNPRALSAAP